MIKINMTKQHDKTINEDIKTRLLKMSNELIEISLSLAVNNGKY